MTLNRILMWDVGAALTRPVTNPLLKFAGGWLVGIMVFGPGSMMIGIMPSDGTVRLLAFALGVLCALTPNRPSLRRGANANSDGPAV